MPKTITTLAVCWLISWTVALPLFATEKNTPKAEAQKTIMVLPFAVRADQDYGFLEKAMAAMLSSRLSLAKDWKPIVYERTDKRVAKALGPAASTSPLDETRAVKLAKANHNDAVVFGAVLIADGIVSTDIFLKSLENPAHQLAFHDVGANAGAVLGHIDQFSAQTLAALGTPLPQTKAPAAKPKSENQVHPEKKFYQLQHWMPDRTN